MYEAPFSPALIVCAGIAGGLVAGVTVGWLIYFGGSTLARWLWNRIEIRTGRPASALTRGTGDRGAL